MASSGIQSPASLVLLLLLLLLLPFFFLSSSTYFSAAYESVEAEKVSRDFFPMEGDMTWVVQISDLHLSAYHPERAEDLTRLLGPALRAIRPDLVLVTGDITDAKNRKRTSTRQDESEWIQYRGTMDSLVQGSVERRRIFDIRGNHDMYGVPYVGSALDFFSVYSTSSQFNRLGSIQSISLVGGDYRYIFVGIDDTMNIGVRGPSNLFGHPTNKRIASVESELQYWDNHPGIFVTKVVFGHFPMSFTASAENGEMYEPMFARQSISAYICGHLHAKFGKQLWRLHTSVLTSHFNQPKTLKEFWEWELGDWKELRFIRILAIDRGDVSFLDIELSSISELSDEFQTTILITYPTDSRSMNRVKEHTKILRNDINVLVFSGQPIFNVTAKVFDSSRDFKIAEEIPLQPATIYSNDKPIFHAKWNAESYRTSSATRYWLQVFVIDSQGKQIASMPRPFSVEGKRAKISPTWLAYLFFYLHWEEAYYVLQWSNVSFLIVLLCLPKLLDLLMVRSTSYQMWAMSASISSSIEQKKLLFRLLWFLIEGSRTKRLWYAMVIYLIYLLTMPWFWGYATSEKGDIYKVSLSGWRIQPSRVAPTGERLGVPDLMTITLPFMYFVVTPLFLLIYCFSAERSAACFHPSEKAKRSDMQVPLESEMSGVMPAFCKNRSRSSGCKMCAGWLRKTLLFASAVIVYLHLKLASSIMAAYGAGPVALSPAISWVPPLLLVTAVYSTMKKT